MEALDTAPAAVPPSPDGRGRGYIPTLDGWRAVAILWVMAYHAAASVLGENYRAPALTWPSVAMHGRFGVDIFFALSGFLICSRLLAERRASGRIDLGAFYARRAFRILPPYYAYLAAVFLLQLAGLTEVPTLTWVACLFFRNYLHNPFAGSATTHFWSLSVEEHFYLLWPGLLVLLATRRRATWAALGLALAVTAWRGLDMRSHILAGRLHLPIGESFWRTDYRLDGLLMGCWLALLADDPARASRLSRWLSPAPWAALLGAFLAIVLLDLPVPLGQFWIATLIPLLVVGTALNPSSPAGRLLEWGPLRWIGRLSYSLYLWQQLFLAREAGGRPLGPFNAFPLDWLSTFACALASYHLVERPMIRLGHRLTRRPDPHAG